MANVNISDLPAATSNAVADVFVCNQSGTTRRSTLTLLFDLIEATGLTFTAAQAFAAITGTTLTLTSYAIANGVKLDSLPAGYRNGTIDAVAASNAITITFETQASATPSATDPVTMTHRSATITSGAITNRNQTAALSLVIPSGATLGCASSEAVRIHVVGILNAGTAMELAVFTGAVTASTSIRRFNPSELASTTAVGAGSDSTQTLYSTTARTDQPLVYLGYIEATSGATAGEWASVDKIVNWEPSVPMPGDVVNIQMSITSSVATGTTVITSDDSIPEITEGDQYMTQAITPKSTMNKLLIEAHCALSHSVADTSETLALFQDATVNALAASQDTAGPAVSGMQPQIEYMMSAGTVSATTFRLRAGGSQVGTTTFNGASGARALGGVNNSTLRITEIHA